MFGWKACANGLFDVRWGLTETETGSLANRHLFPDEMLEMLTC
jgi:hypothetical protein